MDNHIDPPNKDWYQSYKWYADWHNKTYPTDFNKKCEDSRKRQEDGRARIARLDQFKEKDSTKHK